LVFQAHYRAIYVIIIELIRDMARRQRKAITNLHTAAKLVRISRRIRGRKFY